MKKSDNIDHNNEETPRSDPAEAMSETNGSYYYDDATGYEIFEDDEGNEESEPDGESEDRSS